ncbi:MAG: queuosine precursor transporter [Saprospiraceae bacterium]
MPSSLSPLQQPSSKLYIMLAGFFVTNAIVAEFIGIKIFSLEQSFGFQDWNWSLFGNSGSLQFTAGVILWPFVFILTDVINDYFGTKGVRFVTLLAAALIAYAFLMVFLAIWLAPASWWIGSGEGMGVDNMQTAFAAVFGQGLWVIGGSLVAFLVGQLLDAVIFRRIKRITGDRMIWLRATASTIVGQLLDSFVVLYIAFVLGPQQWSMDLFFAVGMVNFGYKLLVAIALIPFLYFVHWVISRYLGTAQASELRRAALATP